MLGRFSPIGAACFSWGEVISGKNVFLGLLHIQVQALEQLTTLRRLFSTESLNLFVKVTGKREKVALHR